MTDNPGFGSPGPNDENAQASVESLEHEQILFEIQFFEPVLEHSPGFVEVLQLLGNHYTRVGRLDDGLAIDRRLVRICPEDGVAHYNLACSLSLTGKPSVAVRELERAVSLGYRDLKHIDSDPDLDNIRHHPAYAALIHKLRNS